jgi:outer membrane protein assembly factor BamB
MAMKQLKNMASSAVAGWRQNGLVAVTRLTLVVMTRFLNGGSSLYVAKRPLFRPIILLLIIASFLLAACGVELPNENWPGLSAAGDVVYVANGQQVVAFDVAQQSQSWRFPNERSSAAFYAAPAVSPDGIILGDYGASGGMFSPKLIVHIYGLAEQTGTPNPAIVWQQDGLTSDKIVAPPLVVENRVYIGAADGKLLALDKTSGQPLWAVPFNTGNAIWGQPAYADGIVYVATVGGRVHAVEAETGQELGRWQTSGAIANAPIVTDEYIYVGSFDSQLHALNRLEYGVEAWNFPAGDWIWGAPVVADGVIYFGDLKGNLFALDATDGSLLWQRSVTGPIQTSPVVSEGVVYLVSQGNLDTGRGQITALASEDGSQLWQQEAPGEVYTTPVLVGDFLIVALHGNPDNLLVGLNRTNGSQQWTFAPAN